MCLSECVSECSNSFKTDYVCECICCGLVGYAFYIILFNNFYLSATLLCAFVDSRGFIRVCVSTKARLMFMT